MIGDIFYKILFYFLEIAFVENSGRSYPVFGISQSALWTSPFLNEVKFPLTSGRKRSPFALWRLPNTTWSHPAFPS